MRFPAFAVWLSRQRRLPYKTRRSLIKRLAPELLKDYPFEADFFEPEFGLRFSGNIVNYIDRLVYFCGAHEKYMLNLLRDYMRRLRASDKGRLLYVDAGANAGNHVLLMSKLADEVHAFEPFERVRQQLQENIELNRLANVQVYPFGLSHKDDVLPFYAAPDSNLGAASFWQDHKQDNYYLGDMHLRRGDDILVGRQGKVAVLKADVEGFEKFVLQGLKRMLEQDRPLAIIELSPKTRETLGSKEAFRDLFPLHYSFYYFASGKHDSGRYRLAPFDYALRPKIQDVIACPDERRIHLLGPALHAAA